MQLQGKILVPTKGAWLGDKSSIILISKVNGLTIDGTGGLIDGSGSSWWPCKNCPRPAVRWSFTLYFRNCFVLHWYCLLKKKLLHIYTLLNWVDYSISVKATVCELLWISHDEFCNWMVQVLSFNSCNGLRVSYLRITNSPKAHITINGCVDAIFSHVTIQSPGDSPNTDGIDISASKNILIKDSKIAAGKPSFHLMYLWNFDRILKELLYIYICNSDLCCLSKQVMTVLQS